METHTRIAPDDIDSARLDAEYYGPNYVSNAKLIMSFGHTTSLEEIRRRSTPIRRGIDMPELSSDPSAPVLVTIAAFEDPGINFRGLDRVSKLQHQAFSGSQIQQGDLLVAMGGYAGKAAVCPSDTPSANIGRHTARISVDPKIADAHYVWAFIRSTLGVLQFDRYITGSVQAGINLEDIRKIAIPRPLPLVQEFLGSKVRQAEKLRAWAKELRAQVDLDLNSLGFLKSDEPKMINRVQITRLEDRLDPRPYRSHFIALADRLSAGRCSRITDIAHRSSGCPVSSEDFARNGPVPLVRIRNIGFDDFIELDTGVEVALHAREAKYHAEEGMIVLGMDGIFRAQFFIAEDLPMLINQRVAMLTAHSIRPELLCHWLNRIEGQMQLDQWAVKTTVEHTSLSDIGRIRVPRLDVAKEDDLADKLMSARLAYRYSRHLTEAAKSLVAALIAGLVTEVDLVKLQQALKAGDNRQDRDLLARLKTDGLDGEGSALFPDLDQLYEMLAQAEPA